jgi:hypothetical protein
MGFTKFLKKKIEDTPEKIAEREAEKTHKLEVKKAYDTAYREAELKAATQRGTLEGAKSTGKKKSLLNTIGAAAEGALVGINKGADAFNKGMGVNTLEIPRQDDMIILPKGNSDIFWGSDQPKKKHRKELYESY